MSEIKRVHKPWGSESWLEVNDHYVIKLLYMAKGQRCSLQYHVEKHETIYVLEGEMKLTIGPSAETLEEKILYPGQYVVVPPNTIHRMEATFNSVYLECSTTQLDDVIRLEDDYGRKE